MVKNVKTWISWERNITFLWNKKIIILCIRLHILRTYCFVVEVTLTFSLMDWAIYLLSRITTEVALFFYFCVFLIKYIVSVILVWILYHCHKMLIVSVPVLIFWLDNRLFLMTKYTLLSTNNWLIYVVFIPLIKTSHMSWNPPPRKMGGDFIGPYWTLDFTYLWGGGWGCLAKWVV